MASDRLGSGMANGSRQTTWDPSRWSSVGMSAKTTIPPSQLVLGQGSNLPINTPINPGQFLGQFGVRVPEIATRKGPGTSPLKGVKPALNPFDLIRGGNVGSRRGLGKLENTAFGTGGLVKFNPEFMVAGLIDARTRGQEFLDGLQTAGISPGMRDALVGRTQPSSADLGFKPYSSDAGIDDLADIPGLPAGPDLSAFDQGGDPRGMKGVKPHQKNDALKNDIGYTRLNKKGQRTATYKQTQNKDGSTKSTLIIYKNDKPAIKMTQYKDNGLTITDTTFYDKDNKPTKKVMEFKNEEGSLTKTETYGKGNIPKEITTQFKNKDGEPVFSFTNIFQEKKRPTDDDLNDKVVTEDALRRWRAKLDGLVNPTGPDSGVVHDVAKLAQKTIAGIQSKINPGLDGDTGTDDSGSDDRRSKLPPGVGPGVVDPSGPTTGGPVPGKPKGPKPSIGPKGLEGAILSRLGNAQVQTGHSSGQAMLNSSPNGDSVPTSTDRDGEVSQR